jgi:hypothetical protein
VTQSTFPKGHLDYEDTIALESKRDFELNIKHQKLNI